MAVGKGTGLSANGARKQGHQRAARRDHTEGRKQRARRPPQALGRALSAEQHIFINRDEDRGGGRPLTAVRYSSKVRRCPLPAVVVSVVARGSVDGACGSSCRTCSVAAPWRNPAPALGKAR
eukprot:363625-Chlamydomonas_euryale.AAC.20